MSRVPDPFILGITGLAGSGKDTVADRLCAQHRFERAAFADPLRNMVEQMLIHAALGYAYVHERSMKERDIPELGMSARKLMQTLGDWGRGLGADFWIRLAELSLGLPDSPIHDRIVITDVRFPNEAEWIVRLGGRIVRVTRDAPAIREHISEQHIAHLGHWWHLDNTADLGYLHAQVDALVASIDGRKDLPEDATQ